jgi:Zn-dependent protease
MSDLFDPVTLVAKLAVLLLALPVHEFAHAWAAYRLGDDTAARQGRLTLNPLAHLDPIGSLMILFSFFGWAKPVPVSPWRLRYGPRVGDALVSVAGPLSNLALAVLVAIPWRLGLLDAASLSMRTFAWIFMAINVSLFLFNLIPLAPLDGNGVLEGVISPALAQKLAVLRQYGPIILLVLIILPRINPILDPLGLILWPAIEGVMRLLVGA